MEPRLVMVEDKIRELESWNGNEILIPVEDIIVEINYRSNGQRNAIIHKIPEGSASHASNLKEYDSAKITEIFQNVIHL